MGDSKWNSQIPAWAVWSVVVCLCLMASWASSKSIDQKVIEAATNVEMLDSFQMSPEGELRILNELDMMLTLDQYKQLYTSTSRNKRKALSDTRIYWPNGIVYYQITESLAGNKSVIKSAIQEWKTMTCLIFRESTTESKRILFEDRGSCWSYVGMQGNAQPLSLGGRCLTHGVVLHEIGHAIGWTHEHNRPDRDEFITINFSVVPKDKYHNYRKYDSDEINTYGIPYDYGSIMHYSNRSIIAKNRAYQHVMGQRTHLSFNDVKLANLMYDCSRRVGCPNKVCPHNGFVFYKSHKGAAACECWCDSGNYSDPLVLCSKIDSEYPGPNLTLSDLSKYMGACYEPRKDCSKMKEEGLCITQIEAMESVCTETRILWQE